MFLGITANKMARVKCDGIITNLVMNVLSNGVEVPGLLLAEQLSPETSFALNVESESSADPPELKMAWGLLEASFGWATDYQTQRDFSESMERFGTLASCKALGRYAYQARAVLYSGPFWQARLEKTDYTPALFAEVYQRRADTLCELSTEIANLEEGAGNKRTDDLIGRQYEDLLLTLDAREALHPSFPGSVREESIIVYGVRYGHDSYRILAANDDEAGFIDQKLPIQSKGSWPVKDMWGIASEVCCVYTKIIVAKSAVKIFGIEPYEALVHKRGKNTRVSLSPPGRTRLLLMTSRALRLEAQGQELDEQEKAYLDEVQDRYTTRLQEFTSAS